MKNTHLYSTRLLYTFLFILFTATIAAQTVQKIGTNSGIIDTNAILELESTNKGFLLPRMNNEERNAIKG
jgi:hypothetical protein